MQKVKESRVDDAMFGKTGDKNIDNGLARISEKIKKKQIFGKRDVYFVNFLLRKKLFCPICRSALACLYLKLRKEKKVEKGSSAWKIKESILSHKEDLDIFEFEKKKNLFPLKKIKIA